MSLSTIPEAIEALRDGRPIIVADDPSLTARGDAGELMEQQPLPVVIGERPIPGDAKLWDHPRGVLESGSRNLDEVLAWLYEQGIRRAFVEGGPTLASAFIAAGLVDEYLVYLAPKLLGGDRLAVGDLGITSVGGARQLRITSLEQLGDDILITARPKE